MLVLRNFERPHGGWGDVSHVAMTNTIVFSHTEGIIAVSGSTVTTFDLVARQSERLDRAGHGSTQRRR